MSITDGFFLLLVYSVKKIDCSGEAIYLTAGISKRAREKIEINPSDRNKQICKHSCRKSRVCLYVSARHYSITVPPKSFLSLSPFLSQVHLNVCKNMDSCHIFFFSLESFHHKFKANRGPNYGQIPLLKPLNYYAQSGISESKLLYALHQ